VKAGRGLWTGLGLFGFALPCSRGHRRTSGSSRFLAVAHPVHKSALLQSTPSSVDRLIPATSCSRWAWQWVTPRKCMRRSGIGLDDCPIGNTILARAAGSVRPTAGYSLPFRAGGSKTGPAYRNRTGAALALGRSRAGQPRMHKGEPGPQEQACALHHRAGSGLQGMGDLRARLR